MPGLEFSLGSSGTVSCPPTAHEIITCPIEVWGGLTTEPQLCSTENVWVMGKPGQKFAELWIENRMGSDRGEIQDVAVKITDQKRTCFNVE
jgi:hypothetical protein